MNVYVSTGFTGLRIFQPVHPVNPVQENEKGEDAGLFPCPPLLFSSRCYPVRAPQAWRFLRFGAEAPDFSRLDGDAVSRCILIIPYSYLEFQGGASSLVGHCAQAVLGVAGLGVGDSLRVADFHSYQHIADGIVGGAESGGRVTVRRRERTARCVTDRGFVLSTDVSPPLLKPECMNAQPAKRCALSYSPKRTAWCSGTPFSGLRIARRGSLPRPLSMPNDCASTLLMLVITRQATPYFL